MACLLTRVTLTAQPYAPLQRSPGCAVLNHVSQFADAAGLLQARIEAIGKVATPAFVFVDDADTVDCPHTVPQGLLYGHESVLQPHKLTRCLPPTAWSLDTHLGNPYLVHRAVCNTRAAQSVACLLPTGDYHIEWLLYFFIAAWRGAQPSADFHYTWHKKATGMHTQMLQASINTSLWLIANYQRILRQLRTLP